MTSITNKNNIEDINFKIINNDLKVKVKTIYHISDIHIHLYKRHTEYKDQFEKLYLYLENEKEKKNINNNRNIECIIAITGDLLHSKSDLSPECIDLTYNFIKKLSDIMPVIIIPGNHDLNMNNKNRLDSISPILADLPSTHPIYYLQESGVYLYSNLVIMHASIFDYNIIPVNKLTDIIKYKINNGILKLSEKELKNIKTIAMYHGRVNGCELFNGSRLEGEKTCKKTITPNDFIGYDIGLCGDIHLQQNILESGNVAYAGSFIQQNLGESLTGHGVLKWNVKSCVYKFKEIKNNYGYATLNIKEGKLEEESILDTLPKNLRLRFLYTNTNPTDINKIVSEIKKTHNILEYNIQNSAIIHMSSCDNYKEENLPVLKKEVNIQNVNYQNELLEEIIKTEIDGVDLKEIDEIKELNKEVNKLVQTEIEIKNNTYNENNLQGNQYKFISLEFSNLYSYGPNNYIKFNELNGVVGIVAPNHMGKSAIIDILLYALFDKFPRKGTIKDIVNIRKDEYYLKLIVSCGYYEYIIEKSGERIKSGNMGKAKCEFLRRNTISGELTNLAKDNIKSTRDYISQYFGHYEDVINTNFSIQTNSTGFIDSENSARRKELERIMRFDYIELLAKKINENIRDCKTVISHLQSTMPPEKIKEVMDEITKYELEIELNVVKLEELQLSLNKYQSQINTLNQKINLDINTQIDNCIKALECDSIDQVSVEVLDNKLSNIKLELESLISETDEYLIKFKKLCRKGIVQRLDVPKKNDMNDFCDNVSMTNLLEYKQLIKLFIKEYKTWNKDQNIEKQVKLKSINNQIRTLEKSIKIYTTPIIKLITSKESIKHEEFIKEYNILLNDYNNTIKFKKAEYEKFINFEKDIKTQTKKISKSENLIKEYGNKILEISNNKMPIEIITKIKEYQITLNNDNTNSNILDLLNDILKSNNINDINNIVNNIIVLYKKEQELGFISWIKSYITNEELLDKEIYKLNNCIEDEYKKIDKYKKKISKLVELLKEKEKLDNELSKIQSDINDVHNDLEIYNLNLETQTKINDLENIKDNLEEELASGTSEVSDYIDNLELLWSQLTENVINKKDYELEIVSLEKVSSGLDILLVQLEENTKLQEEILSITEIQNTVLEEYNNLSQKTQYLRDKYSINKGHLEKMRKDCEIKIEKERILELLDIYKIALKFIPMILINKIKPILSRKVNDLLSVVTNFTLDFNFDDNKIDIYLSRSSYNNKTIIINNASGFERFISSIAIRLALMEISKLPSPNVMIIDEGWSCFDNENLNNMDVIFDHLKQKFDFILTISHLQTIRQHCDFQIGLVKDNNGFSKVTFG